MKCFDLKLYEKFEFLKEYDSSGYVEIYLPKTMYELERTDNKRPCMILCPGSAYIKCCERESEPVAIRLMEMGFNVFVLQYSTAPAHYPVQLLEAAALFNLITDNAEEYNADVSRIGIMGFSAGGHLASHYSTSYNHDIIKRHFEKIYKPFATVLCYPVISGDESIWNQASFENLAGHFPDEEERQLLSTDKLVSQDTPTAFIWHTAGDTYVPPENSMRYAQALAKYRIPFALYIYPYGNHGMITADRETLNRISGREKIAADWIQKLKEWVNFVFFNGTM